MSSVSIVPSFVVNAPKSQPAPFSSSSDTIVKVGAIGNTIYIQNINEKAPIRMLLQDLTRLFSGYGEIVQIVAKRRLALRGQAFIVFSDANDARRALETQQSRPLYGKPLVLRYAKFKSAVIAKADGSWPAEQKRILQDRQDRLEAAPQRQSRKQLMEQLLTASTAKGQLPTASSAITAPTSNSLLNKTLYLQQVPAGKDLDSVFAGFAGFYEVRLVPGRPDLAFVDFETELAANAAKLSLPDMNICFAKK